MQRANSVQTKKGLNYVIKKCLRIYYAFMLKCSMEVEQWIVLLQCIANLFDVHAISFPKLWK